MKPPKADNGLRQVLAEVAYNLNRPIGAMKWLAYRLGVDLSAVHHWLTGRRVPNEAMKARIAEELGLYPRERSILAERNGTAFAGETLVCLAAVRVTKGGAR